jgi:hypothetical protein
VQHPNSGDCIGYFDRRNTELTDRAKAERFPCRVCLSAWWGNNKTEILIMKEDRVIFSDSPEAATLVMVELWKSSRGKYYSKKDEAVARRDGATHIKCECGNVTEKMWTSCKVCRDKRQAERYAKLSVVEWDGKTPLCLYRDDEFFYSIEDIEAYCEEYEVSVEDLCFVLCERMKPPQVDVDSLFEDHLTDEISDIPDEIYKAAKEFNAILSEYAPKIWVEGDKVVRLQRGMT